MASVYFFISTCTFSIYGSRLFPISGRSISIESVQPIRPITTVAHMTAQNHRITPATKLGQSIRDGERVYSINSSRPVASIALIRFFTFSSSFDEGEEIGFFFAADGFLTVLFGVFSFSVDSILELIILVAL